MPIGMGSCSGPDLTGELSEGSLAPAEPLDSLCLVGLEARSHAATVPAAVSSAADKARENARPALHGLPVRILLCVGGREEFQLAQPSSNLADLFRLREHNGLAII